MIKKGDKISDIELRTDQGTPLSLADLTGRAVAVFLLGSQFTPTGERLLKVLKDSADRFLSLEFSPIAISGEPSKELAKYNKQNKLPYLLVSDGSIRLHHELRGDDGDGIAVWIVSSHGDVIDTVPRLPPTELVNVVLERISRFCENRA